VDRHHLPAVYQNKLPKRIPGMHILVNVNSDSART